MSDNFFTTLNINRLYRRKLIFCAKIYYFRDSSCRFAQPCRGTSHKAVLNSLSSIRACSALAWIVFKIQETDFQDAA